MFIFGPFVDAHLEVQVRPEAAPGAAGGADDLALGDRLADGDADVRLVRVRASASRIFQLVPLACATRKKIKT